MKMVATVRTSVRRMRAMHHHSRRHAALEDIFLLSLSLLVAVFLALSGAVPTALSFFTDFSLVAVFIAGIFSASVFTIAPASVALAELARTVPDWTVILIGAAGSVVGDLFLFYFIKDHLMEDVITLLSKHRNRALENIIGSSIFHRLTPVIGALIIASPLPDELGLAMMGLTKTRRLTLIAVSFTMNILCVATIVGISKLF